MKRILLVIAIVVFLFGLAGWLEEKWDLMEKVS
jgi:hypothetical protein